jgi:hypothetical protein
VFPCQFIQGCFLKHRSDIINHTIEIHKEGI